MSRSPEQPRFETARQFGPREAADLERDHELRGRLAAIEAADRRLAAELQQRGIEPGLERLELLRQAEVVSLRPLPPGVRGESESHLMMIRGQSRNVAAIFKPAAGERPSPFDAPGEIKAVKEWLGYRLDQLLAVRRSPAAVLREVRGEAGAAIDFRSGENCADSPWIPVVDDPAEVARMADFHYLVGETDGHDGQYILGPDGLATIDRGEALFERDEFISSVAVFYALQEELPANPEVLSAARQLRDDEELQAALNDAFRAGCGLESGDRRFGALLRRLEKYVTAGRVPPDTKIPEWALRIIKK